MGKDRRYRYVHGTYVENKNQSAIVAGCKNVDTGNTELKIFKNYRRPFWVTRPAMRVHSHKKEYAPESELDMKVVPQHQMAEAICKALDEKPAPWKTVRRMCGNPYVYGADIDPRLVLKNELAEACPEAPRSYNVGHFDIEASVITETGEINCASFIDGNSRQVYLGMLKGFSGDVSEDDITDLFIKEKAKYREQLSDEAKELLDQKEFTLNIRVFDSELELIKGMFRAIHRHKPDFVGIWNINYDIPKIIERLEALGEDPANIICHPDVPKEFKYLKYTEDTRQDGVEWNERWHWLSAAGPTQFIDSMVLYSRLRKAAGKEVSYALDYIAGSNLGTGKLDLGSGSHHYMQRHHFTYYAVYNIFDTINTLLLEDRNSDYTKLVNLVGTGGLLQDFATQTKQLKNFFYVYCRSKGLVPAAVGSNMKIDGDDDLASVGGNVLDPLKSRNTGVAALEETDMPTGLCKFVSDLDVQSWQQDPAPVMLQ